MTGNETEKSRCNKCGTVKNRKEKAQKTTVAKTQEHNKAERAKEAKLLQEMAVAQQEEHNNKKEKTGLNGYGK